MIGYSKTSLLSLSVDSRIGELREVMADIVQKQCDQDQYDALSKDEPYRWLKTYWNSFQMQVPTNNIGSHYDSNSRSNIDLKEFLVVLNTK